MYKVMREEIEVRENTTVIKRKCKILVHLGNGYMGLLDAVLVTLFMFEIMLK